MTDVQEGPPPTEEAIPKQAETSTETASQDQQPKKDAQEESQKANGDPATATTTDAADAPKLTGAQLKAKAKAEKAARRAQSKATKDVTKESAGADKASSTDPKVAKGKGKQGDGASTSGAGSKISEPKGSAPPPIVDPRSSIPECFSHIAMARQIPMTQADKDVHPAVLAIGQQMASFAIDGSTARLTATLHALKSVINDYKTPTGNTLARHFTPHVLNPQIDYLTACRPMCFSMGNAIRWLKLQVSKIDPDVAEQDAKDQLCEGIDTFVQERISVADIVIMEKGADMIEDGDVILTFGHSSLVEETLLHASKARGKKFKVFVVDETFERRGQTMAKNLLAENIQVTYCGDFGGLEANMEVISRVFLGAESMFNNGAMYGKCGSCDVAGVGYSQDKPIVVLCETISITDRVAIDSLTYNEIDPHHCSAANFRLLYDTTPKKYISIVVTELGSVDSASMTSLLRKLEEYN